MFKKLFSKKKENVDKKESKIMFCIERKIKIMDKELLQKQYFSEHYSVLSINGKNILFDPEKMQNFLVDTENETLTALDGTQEKAQTQALKNALGEVSIDEVSKNTLKISNNSETVKIEGELEISIIEGIESTCYETFIDLQKDISFLNIDLLPNKIIKKMDIILDINGNKQNQYVEVISVKKDLSVAEDYDNFITFEING